jgi:hypothetical protein
MFHIAFSLPYLYNEGAKLSKISLLCNVLPDIYALLAANVQTASEKNIRQISIFRKKITTFEA